MEKGFFHPDLGYWQTSNEPSQEIIEKYPQGTIEVPLKPSAYFEWVDGEWTYVSPPPPSKEEQELRRRASYVEEADPLFFMSQRGEATIEEWQAKVAEIKARYPYPEV